MIQVQFEKQIQSLKLNLAQLLQQRSVVSSDRPLHWPIKYVQAHIPGRLLCNEIAAILLFSSQLSQWMKCFDKVLSRSIINHCAVFRV